MRADRSKTIDLDHLTRGFFKDEWMVKAGVGGVMAAAALLAFLYSYVCLPISVALWALMIGYCLRCIRHKAANPDCKLPDWNEWGDLFMSGVTWIALQTGVWALIGSIAFFALAYCIGLSFNEKNSALSTVWIALGVSFYFSSIFATALISTYTMANFAIGENAKAGLAFIKVTRSIFANPDKLLAGFLLAQGIQSLAVLLPCITVIGVFLVPSVFFIGQILSALVIARHWSACNPQNQSGS